MFPSAPLTTRKIEALSNDTQLAFVDEVEIVARDPMYWVRREASLALGALAKVVPQQVIIHSLASVFLYSRTHR